MKASFPFATQLVNVPSLLIIILLEFYAQTAVGDFLYLGKG
jgi:hypothetical protein